MKLIAQSDDYGMTRGCAQGALHAIRNGIIRNTGFFTNMPWAEECYEWIRPYVNDIAFGIDLNASTGPSVLPHDQIPHLTHEDGMFLTSKEHKAQDNEENQFDHLREYKDEVYAEFDAQIRKFITLTGKKPDYIHGHAYFAKTTAEVLHELAVKYGCVNTMTIMNDVHENVLDPGMKWYAYGDPAKQLASDLRSFLKADLGGYFTTDKEYGYLICHCGYADAELFDLSSFNTCRTKDLEAVTDPEVIQIMKNHNVELITFKDLPASFMESDETI